MRTRCCIFDDVSQVVGESAFDIVFFELNLKIVDELIFLLIGRATTLTLGFFVYVDHIKLTVFIDPLGFVCDVTSLVREHCNFVQSLYDA